MMTERQCGTCRTWSRRSPTGGECTSYQARKMGLSYTHASFVCRYWCASGEQPSGEPVLCLAEVVGRAAHKVEVVARRLRDEKAAGAEEAEELACRLCALLDLATKVDELASARAER